MPGTTPVYGFPYPEPTDLVADYPALGQQLAEDIEDVLPTIGGLAPATPTSIANSGGTATLSGNTVTFSGVSSVSLNGCFTGDYDNYRVFVNLASASLTCQIRLRWVTSTTPDTSSNYWVAEHQVAATGSHTIPVSGSSNTSAHIGHYIATSSGPVDMSLEVFRPFAAAWTRHVGQGSVGIGGISDFSMIQTGSLHKVTTSYDGFQLMNLESATMTGTVSVYGYKK